jgi:hypothetical protein
MKPSFLFCAFLFIAATSFAQSIPQAYFNNIKIADSLYDAKDYKNSAKYYSKAFEANGWKGMADDRYNAACSYALAGGADSSFFMLEKVATKMNYTNYGHITTDPDLISLHNDPRWKSLLVIIKQNKEKAEANLNKPLVAMLDTIMIDDQSYRQQIDGVESKYGSDSKQMRALWQTINEKDSINLIKVTGILDKSGWVRGYMQQPCL